MISIGVSREHKSVIKREDKFESFMSEKKRNQEMSFETVSLELAATTNKQIVVETVESNDSNRLNKSGRIAYLKSHFGIVGLIALLTLGAMGAGLKYLEETAQKESLSRNSSNREQNLFSRLNPFSAPLPTPTPLQLSKELIYSGNGRLLAVEDANANAAPPADLAIWRPTSGEWWVMSSAGSQQTTQAWGAAGDKPVPGDFDGDGKTDFSIFRPTNGNWYFVYSTGSSGQIPFGQNGDQVAQADYDGDGKTDAAIFRPNTSANTGTWYINRSSDGGATVSQFGLADDVPATGDYDGDGKADIGVWRNSNFTFYVLRSSDSQLQTAIFGQNGDVPVSGDYDGDGRANFALKRGNQWIILNSAGTQTQTIPWELASDVEVRNDYDGDGKLDIAVWRNSNGRWYIRNSSTGNKREEQWGISGDTPVPALYKRQ